MRPIRKVLRNAFTQPPFWSLPDDGLMFRSLVGEKESIGNSFVGYVDDAYKSNGIVAACIAARLFVFSEARFQWREFRDGRPGRLFGNPELAILEEPWANGTTGELLAHMEQDSSLAGNFYGARVENRIRRLRPDWVTIVTGSKSGNPYDLDAQPIAYVYAPPRSDPTILTPDQVVHYSPLPDPIAQWRGMSWLTPILREVMGDTAATKHKLKFFENGAVPGLVIKYDASVGKTVFDAFVEDFRKHEGSENAYKTVHLGGGADVVVAGANLKQLDFKNTQGAGETRVAAAARVHPVLVGLSEGLAGSSLNAGNYAAARRGFADGTIRPLWRIAAGSLQTILKRPDNASLWYDDRDIAFLRQDAKEEAEIDQTQANTIKQLVDAGFIPDSVIDAVMTGDFSRLKHSGLFSVQLQPAGHTQPTA